MICSHCRAETPENRNFCQTCGHKVRDLAEVIRLGKGCRIVPSIERFWETGNPSVFARPGALDYDPRLV